MKTPNKEEVPKMVTFVVSQKKIEDVKMTLSKMTFDLQTHQQLQGLIDYLIKE